MWMELVDSDSARGIFHWLRDRIQAGNVHIVGNFDTSVGIFNRFSDRVIYLSGRGF